MFYMSYTFAVVTNRGLENVTDDTHLYVHCRCDDMASTAVRLKCCLLVVDHWMSSNQLKLNATKLSCCGLQGDVGMVILPWVTEAHFTARSRRCGPQQ